MIPPRSRPSQAPSSVPVRLAALCLLFLALSGCVTHHYAAPEQIPGHGDAPLGTTSVVATESSGGTSLWAGIERTSSFSATFHSNGYGHARYAYQWPYFGFYYPAYGWSPIWRPARNHWHDSWAWWAPYYRYSPWIPWYAHPHDGLNPGSAPGFGPQGPIAGPGSGLGGDPVVVRDDFRSTLDPYRPSLPEDRGYSAAFLQRSPTATMQPMRPGPGSASWQSRFRGADPSRATAVRSGGNEKFLRSSTQPVRRESFPTGFSSSSSLRNPASSTSRSSSSAHRPAARITPSSRTTTLQAER